MMMYGGRDAATRSPAGPRRTWWVWGCILAGPRPAKQFRLFDDGKRSGRWGALRGVESGLSRAVDTSTCWTCAGMATFSRPRPGSLSYTVTASCGKRVQHIATAWTPCRFGGKRPWFQCGAVGAKSSGLYFVQAVFACRHCHRLGHASQLETPHERGTGRARRIRMRLSDGTDDPYGEFSSRPRFMHRTTYERWRRAHDDAEGRSAMGLMNCAQRLGRRTSRRA